eukprot:3156934-Pyramimonas_sp.AAC.1
MARSAVDIVPSKWGSSWMQAISASTPTFCARFAPSMVRGAKDRPTHPAAFSMAVRAALPCAIAAEEAEASRLAQARGSVRPGLKPKRLTEGNAPTGNPRWYRHAATRRLGELRA